MTHPYVNSDRVAPALDNDQRLMTDGGEIETPFPVEGAITPTKNGYSANVPCASEWLDETKDGDYMQKAADHAARKYGEGISVNVRFTESRSAEVCGGYELLGPVDDDTDEDEEGPQTVADGGTRWIDLRGFQRDLLEVILDAADSEEPQSGQDLRRELEAHRGETINHGRLYPNLDELTARGLIDCQEIDGRTNGYTPTAAAIELYIDHDERTSRIAAQYDIESERSALVADGGAEVDR